MVAVDGDNEKKAEFIADPKERMLKWNRMSESVMKKARELSTLCDTPTCIVISPPTNEDGTTPMDSCSSKFAIWPTPTQDDHGASLRRMIDLYKASQSCKTDSSPSTVKARASKKVKVNKYNNDVDVGLATTSVSCGRGSPSIQTDCGNVVSGRQVEEAGKSALVAVNARMDQIQTRIDQINSRKRKSPSLDSAGHDDTIVNVEENNNINAIIDACGAASAKERDDVDDVIDFNFLNFAENDSNTIHQGGSATTQAGGKEAAQAELTNDSTDADMYNGHYFIDMLQDEDDKFETIFEQQNDTHSSFYHDDIIHNDSTSWFTNPTAMTLLPVRVAPSGNSGL